VVYFKNSPANEKHNRYGKKKAKKQKTVVKKRKRKKLTNKTSRTKNR